MCLHYDKELSKKCRAAIVDGTATFYKKYDVVWSALKKKWIISAYFQQTRVKFNKSGIVVSDRRSILHPFRNPASLTRKEIKSQEINHGIHVYIGVVPVTYDYHNDFYIPVTVNVEDFVAATNQSAVFVKIKIDPAEFQKRIERAMARGAPEPRHLGLQQP